MTNSPDMSERDLLLVITICKLLDKDVSPLQVLQQYRIAKGQLDYYLKRTDGDT